MYIPGLVNQPSPLEGVDTGIGNLMGQIVQARQQNKDQADTLRLGQQLQAVKAGQLDSQSFLSSLFNTGNPKLIQVFAPIADTMMKAEASRSPLQYMPEDMRRYLLQHGGEMPSEPQLAASNRLFAEAQTKPDLSHNTVEIPSPDGKMAQKFQYNPETKAYDKPIGGPYLVKSQMPQDKYDVGSLAARAVAGDPVAEKILARITQVTGEKAGATVEAQRQAQEALVTPELVQLSWDTYKAKGTPPVMLRNLFRLPYAGIMLQNEMSKMAKTEGWTGEKLAQAEADFKALVSGEQAIAKVPGSSQAVQIITASDLYDKEMPELIVLRKKVAANGFLPSSRFKDVEQINQWIGTKTSDPDTALLKKKTKFLADSLQRAVGGTQGGQWAFDVAADILDPSFAPDAFERIFSSHGTALRRKAYDMQNYGGLKIENPDQSEQPKGQAPKQELSPDVQKQVQIIQQQVGNGKITREQGLKRLRQLQGIK